MQLEPESSRSPVPVPVPGPGDGEPGEPVVAVHPFEDPPTGAFSANSAGSDSDATSPGLPHQQGTVSGIFSNPPLFSAGQIVAERYEIIGFLARGGMGEVYEALDQDLGERIALKSIGSEHINSDDALQRFKRELSLARKVTHPNVCRTYDLFHHVEADGRRVACLSMELLSGETLSRRLRTQGRMDPELVLSAAQQMTAALEAAHAVGVIHRDLKPSNVMLVKSSSGEGSLRVVITDFGLAFSQETLDRAHQTGMGTFQGTPAYMSPEQVEGGPITPRSDIYELGLVVFEMLTGEAAFKGSNPVSTATKRLKEVAPSPRSLVPDLKPFWDQVLARCLARKPEDRFASATELLAALDPDPPLTLPMPRHKGRTLLVATVTALVLGGGGLVAWRSTHGVAPWARSLALRPSIAVLGFRNLGADAKTKWRDTALSEMLGTELSLDEKLRLISGSDVARMRADLGLSDSPDLSGESLSRIRKNLGSDLLVAGSFVDTGAGAFRVDLKLLDAKSGQVIATVREEGSDRDILGVVHRAGQKLRGSLGLSGDSTEAIGMMVASYPQNFDAMRNYGEALDRLRKFDALAAKDFLEKAVAAQPRFPLAHAALSEAWTQLGYDAKAKDEAKLATDQAKGLSREDRLRVEARSAVAEHQWDQAIAAYQALYGFFPDQLDYGLGLAQAQRMAGKYPDALATLDRLGAGPASADPRLPLEGSYLAMYMGQTGRQKDLVAKAIALAQAKHSKLLLAEILMKDGSVRRQAGDFSGAFKSYDQAKALWTQGGNMRGVVATLRVKALAEAEAGSFEAARRDVAEATNLCVQIGNPREEAELQVVLAMIQTNEGSPAEGAQTIQKALSLMDEVHSPLGSAWLRINEAYNLYDQGRVREAGQVLDPVLTLAKSSHAIGLEAGVLLLKGMVAYAEGRLDEAQHSLDGSANLLNTNSEESTKGLALRWIGRVQWARGDRNGACSRLTGAYKILDASGSRVWTADCALDLANLALEQGQFPEAKVWREKADSIYQGLNLKEGQSRAAMLGAAILLAEGRRDEALRAMPGAYPGGFMERQVEAGLLEARLSPSLGASQSALKLAAKRALESGSVPLQLETRLVQAQLGADGKGANTKALLKLEQDARALGFENVARRARRALERQAS